MIADASIDDITDVSQAHPLQNIAGNPEEVAELIKSLFDEVFGNLITRCMQRAPIDSWLDDQIRKTDVPLPAILYALEGVKRYNDKMFKGIQFDDSKSIARYMNKITEQFSKEAERARLMEKLHQSKRELEQELRKVENQIAFYEK